MKKVLITGAAGFIGTHLERRLKDDGHFVVSAGRKPPKYGANIADEFHVLDLRDRASTYSLMVRYKFDEVYQLAGDVGGLGYIATGEYDAEIMTNSTRINIAVLEAARQAKLGKIFFASSQCVYPDTIEIDPFASERIPDTIIQPWREQDACFTRNFAFAKEKLYAEALYEAYARNYGIEVRIGRVGNTYGPYSTWDGDRAKSVASICRKVAAAPYAGTVKLWGDGTQRRSFTYVDDVIDGMLRLMESDYSGPGQHRSWRHRVDRGVVRGGVPGCQQSAGMGERGRGRPACILAVPTTRLLGRCWAGSPGRRWRWDWRSRIRGCGIRP